MNVQVKTKSSANPLLRLHDHGQAVWLDFLSRRFIAEGGLKKLIEQDGLTGVTSNPSIFEKAIAGSADYDSSLKAAESCGRLRCHGALRAARDRGHPARGGRAAPGLRRNQTPGRLCQPRSLALSGDEHRGDGRRGAAALAAVGRDNLMIKVPATKPGLPAIRQLIGEGINVNITLLFSQQVYEEVVEAYLAGLEHLIAQGGDPARLQASPVSSSAASTLRSTSSSKNAFAKTTRPPSSARRWPNFAGRSRSPTPSLPTSATSVFSPARVGRSCRAKGARVQRLLWASTGTKNKDYSDVLYVEELIAPDTVNTVPPATMDAFRDHGKVRREPRGEYRRGQADDGERWINPASRSTR